MGETSEGQREQETPRLPYEKPSIAWEESVESQSRLMSSCGKLLGGGGACFDTPSGS